MADDKGKDKETAKKAVKNSRPWKSHEGDRPKSKSNGKPKK